jgi:hypothetical protein
VDLIQKRRRVNESVTSVFVTNIIEIKNDALKQLQPFSGQSAQEEQKTEQSNTTNNHLNNTSAS